MSIENLKTYNDRTEEEQRDLVTKGGIASGVARRKKKKLKDLAQAMLSCKADSNTKQITQALFPDIEPDEITVAAGILAAQIEKAMGGDTRAFEVIRDTSGQKPVDQHEDLSPISSRRPVYEIYKKEEVEEINNSKDE